MNKWTQFVSQHDHCKCLQVQKRCEERLRQAAAVRNGAAAVYTLSLPSNNYKCAGDDGDLIEYTWYTHELLARVCQAAVIVGILWHFLFVITKSSLSKMGCGGSKRVRVRSQ